MVLSLFIKLFNQGQILGLVICKFLRQLFVFLMIQSHLGVQLFDTLIFGLDSLFMHFVYLHLLVQLIFDLHFDFVGLFQIILHHLKIILDDLQLFT